MLRLRVKPGSRRDRIVGAYGGALKLEVSAPPEKGKANTAVRKLLAKTFGVPVSAVEVLTGATGQDKTIRIGGVSRNGIVRVLDAMGIESTER